MTGNDVVDLDLASKKQPWKNHRFLDKVFTVHEQSLIANADEQAQILWLLWSMKESAYKIHVRHAKETFFMPHMINCQMHSLTEGEAEISGIMYQTQSQLSAKYIYTTAKGLAGYKVANWCFTVDKSDYIEQHNECYRQARCLFSALTGNSSEELDIIKNPLGVPEFWLRGERQDAFLSITHHGRYGGVALALPQ